MSPNVNVERALIDFSWFLAAFRAGAEDLQGGALRGEVLFTAYFVLYLLQTVADEFDDVAAFQTDEMVVAGAAKCLLVSRRVLSEPVFGHETAILQEVKRIIDGRLRDLDPLGNHPVVQRLGIEMPLALQYRIKNGKALGSRAELPLRAQVPGQRLVCRFNVHLLPSLELVQINIQTKNLVVKPCFKLFLKCATGQRGAFSDLQKWREFACFFVRIPPILRHMQLEGSPDTVSE